MTPSRRPGSLRRTTALDFFWTAGLLGPCTVLGTGRDLLSRSDGATVVGTGQLRVTAGQVASGYRTPAAMFGSGFIEEFKDCELVIR
jgi:hypothetical protein